MNAKETAENYVKTQILSPEAIEHLLQMIANAPGFAEKICRGIERDLEFRREVAESDGTPESYAILFHARTQEEMNDNG